MSAREHSCVCESAAVGIARLVEQLHKRALDFAVSAGPLAKAAPPNGIYLILSRTPRFSFKRVVHTSAGWSITA